jgi:hypothetical protein
MQQRKIGRQMIELTLAYGRERAAHSRRLAYVIGPHEISCHRQRIDLSDLAGLVVIVSRTGHVITCYWDRR